jgi:hypothetical protein
MKHLYLPLAAKQMQRAPLLRRKRLKRNALLFYRKDAQARQTWAREAHDRQSAHRWQSC